MLRFSYWFSRAPSVPCGSPCQSSPCSGVAPKAGFGTGGMKWSCPGILGSARNFLQSASMRKEGPSRGRVLGFLKIQGIPGQSGGRMRVLNLRGNRALRRMNQSLTFGLAASGFPRSDRTLPGRGRVAGTCRRRRSQGRVSSGSRRSQRSVPPSPSRCRQRRRAGIPA